MTTEQSLREKFLATMNTWICAALDVRDGTVDHEREDDARTDAAAILAEMVDIGEVSDSQSAAILNAFSVVIQRYCSGKFTSKLPESYQ
jgi:hypothetical protein